MALNGLPARPAAAPLPGYHGKRAGFAGMAELVDYHLDADAAYCGCATDKVGSTLSKMLPR